MAHHIADQIYNMVPGEIKNVAIDFTNELESDGSELLTGTPTAVERTTSNLSVTSVVVNTASINILGKTVAIGKAVQFSLDATNIVAKTSYKIDVTVSTDSTPAQTFISTIRITGSAV